MTYAVKIREILSDGTWHCIMDLIAETGLSARNRISEMNLYNTEQKGYKKYESESCKLEKCNHKADLYMYKLSEDYVKEVQAKSKIINDKNIHLGNQWDLQSVEDKKKKINEMLSKAGIK